MSRPNRRYGMMALAALLSLPWSARACMSVSPQGAQVQIMDEAAVIVWDAATHTEHFVRRATFNTEARDFGFLVPTPDVPQLTEVGNDVFDRLQKLTAPEEREETRRHFNFLPLFGDLPTDPLLPTLSKQMAVKSAVTAGAAGGVQVLNRTQVGGYDAVVLEADQAGALSDWLKAHGYAARSTLTDWLAPYVAAHWKITAFKIAKPAGQGIYEASSPASLAAVRLSFHTDRPFYPYREPADARTEGNYAPGRWLSAIVLSTERVDGRLGAAPNAPLWPGQVQWTNRLPDSARATAASSLKLSAKQLPANLWMTVMLDASSPRPGTDEVYFAPAPTQTPIVPNPIIHYHDVIVPVPLDAVAIFGSAGFGVVWALRRIQRFLSTRRAGHAG
jgi:hypothetical protein